MNQVADKFYQEVIDTENYNATLINTMHPAKDTVDKITQKISFFDPSDYFKSNLKGNPACLLFNIDTVQEAMVSYIALVRTDPNYTKALPSMIDYENITIFCILTT